MVWDEILSRMFSGGVRIAIKEALESLNCRHADDFIVCDRVHLILSLPTGYGKSTLSMVIANALKEYPYPFNNFRRLIHVAPTRSLIEDLYNRSVNRFGLKTAVQFSLAQHDIKAPFFLPSFVITTYDSFMLNMYKAVIAEPRSTYGHFELPRYSIYSSLIHFDEYHLLAYGDSDYEVGESIAWTTLVTTVRELANAGVQLILSTATPSKALEEELATILSGFSNPSAKVVSIHVVSEKGTVAKNRNCEEANETQQVIRWQCEADGGVSYDLLEVVDKQDVADLTTEIIKEDSLVDKVSELVGKTPPCNCSPRVLVVANTVGRAVSWYKLLKSKLRGSNICLLHSRYTSEDKEGILNKVRSECDVLVTTQVIEVGVDLNACNLVTELAPVPALVQRAGRVLRLSDCVGKSGAMYIVDTGDHLPYDKQEVEETKKRLLNNANICWKLPYGCHNKDGYSKFIDDIYKSAPNIDTSLEAALRSLDEDVYTTKRELRSVLRRYCSLVRSTALITVFIGKKASGLELNDVIKKSLTIDTRTLYSLIKKNNYDPCKVLKCKNKNGNRCVEVVMNKTSERSRGVIVDYCDDELLNAINKALNGEGRSGHAEFEEFNRRLCPELNEFHRIVKDTTYSLIAVKINPKLYDHELGLVGESNEQ